MVGVEAEVGLVLDVEGLLEFDLVDVGVGGDSDEVAVFLGFLAILSLREVPFEEVPLIRLLPLPLFQLRKFLLRDLQFNSLELTALVGLHKLCVEDFLLVLCLFELNSL